MKYICLAYHDKQGLETKSDTERNGVIDECFAYSDVLRRNGHLVGGEPKNLRREHNVVSQEEWIAARKELLKKEKESTRLRDQLSAERRKLPWVKVAKNYVFDAPGGKVTLADLFGGSSQLVIYHFMFGPDWQEACPSCSFVSDHIDGALAHLAARDVTMVMVSRAPLARHNWW